MAFLGLEGLLAKAVKRHPPKAEDLPVPVITPSLASKIDEKQAVSRLRRAFILVQANMPSEDGYIKARNRPITDVIYGEEKAHIDHTHKLITQLVELQNKLVEYHYDYLSEQASNTAHRLAEQRDIEVTYDRFLDVRKIDPAQAKGVLDEYNGKLRRANQQNVLHRDPMKGNVIEQTLDTHGPLVRSVLRDLVHRVDGRLQPNWDVADRYTRAGFTISFDRSTGKLVLQFNETLHRLVYSLRTGK